MSSPLAQGRTTSELGLPFGLPVAARRSRATSGLTSKGPPLVSPKKAMPRLVVDPSRMIESRDGHSNYHLLSLWRRKHRQERQGSQRQAEVPLPRLRQAKPRGSRL